MVQRVIAAHTKEWCEQNLGGVWVETFIDDMCGVGYSYDEKKGLFVAPKPKYKGVEITNMVLDSKGKWKPPIEDPKDGRFWSIFTNEWLTKEEIDVQIMEDRKK